MTNLSQRLPMIPNLTASLGKAESLARDYMGWELLEMDDRAEKILICKPYTDTSTYTRSQSLLILCGEVAAAWVAADVVSSKRATFWNPASTLLHKEH